MRKRPDPLARSHSRRHTCDVARPPKNTFSRYPGDAPLRFRYNPRTPPMPQPLSRPLPHRRAAPRARLTRFPAARLGRLAPFEPIPLYFRDIPGHSGPKNQGRNRPSLCLCFPCPSCRCASFHGPPIHAKTVARPPPDHSAYMRAFDSSPPVSAPRFFPTKPPLFPGYSSLLQPPHPPVFLSCSPCVSWARSACLTHPKPRAQAISRSCIAQMPPLAASF